VDEEEEKLLNLDRRDSLIGLNDMTKKIVEESFQKVDEWLETKPSSDSAPLLLPKQNSFFRRVIYERLKERYGNSIITKGIPNGSKGEKMIEISIPKPDDGPNFVRELNKVYHIYIHFFYYVF
jgi:hypothetical protein